MTVGEVIRQTLALLNYTDTRVDGEVPGGHGLYKRVLPLVNQTAAELWFREHSEPFPPLRDLQATVPLPDRVVQTVLPYGVAMLLAAADGDADNQTLFASLYDGHRTATTETAYIVDTQPTTE